MNGSLWLMSCGIIHFFRVSDVDKNMLKQDANKSNLGAASSDAGEVNSSEDRVEGSDLNSSDSGAENFAAELSKNNK